MRNHLFLGALVLCAALSHLQPTLPPVAQPEGPLWEAPTLQLVHPEDALLEMDARMLASLALAEDPQAPAAVMWTAINRSKECSCPLVEVVTTGEAYGTLKRWDPDGPMEWRPSWGRRWTSRWARTRLDDLEGLAYEVLLGLRADPTHGATHFHRKGTWEPPWAPPLDRRIVFGSHYFYRELSPDSSV
jgi:hypothetical protein